MPVDTSSQNPAVSQKAFSQNHTWNKNKSTNQMTKHWGLNTNPLTMLELTQGGFLLTITQSTVLFFTGLLWPLGCSQGLFPSSRELVKFRSHEKLDHFSYIHSYLLDNSQTGIISSHLYRSVNLIFYLCSSAFESLPTDKPKSDNHLPCIGWEWRPLIAYN